MGKKQATESVNSKLALVMKSGKAFLGYKSTMKALRKGNLKAIFVAQNTPSIVKAEINYYALLANCHVYPYTGNNIDLGKLYNLLKIKNRFGMRKISQSCHCRNF